ncbi:type I polyketide synthase [Hartmannibacter diazotrophicus]|uniref:type I polyketide synthase n=1 Tax=Hartmannibacter diazotrophicus TaxID=1482074 RepID=UPI0018D51B18|nr:type I polyketide synthase [Hartmannibacter diazotrophicus]
MNDIAIVGYSCRLPKASTADEFWGLLDRGECVISEVQPDRWSKRRFGHPGQGVVGRSYTWAAGQIEDIWGFDPVFFGISPREAEQMDPQQRLLLQVAWEAFEHSGIRPSDIAGTETGVYVGASGMDYSHSLIVDTGSGDTQSMTGSTLSIVSNRISYIFDLRGPSFTVDTACSSSIVAMHEALEAIRAGRIDTAVVAGVNVLLSPFAFVGFSRASMLSPTGLCRAFDAAGDGYVRSEGAVAIVLRRADVARAAGNPIRSLVVGSGINSDGRTAGLSLPSTEQQAALLEQVYERFEIDPRSLAYVEAHGTGTRAGDPIEANALGTILGRRRTSPLPIGSVKTNIGHLESASGLAGLLKVQLALEKGRLPASLHFNTPNPDIDFEGLNLEVVSEGRLIVGEGPHHIGINSFGFGGANAHVVLKEAVPTMASERPEFQAPLVVSARSREALKALAERYRDRLDAANDGEARIIANAAAYRRDHLDYRVVVPGDRQSDLVKGLDAFLAGERSAISAQATARNGKVAFLYSGNGSQWAGMGMAAYQTDPDFQQAFETINRLFMRVAGWSLLTTLFSEDLENDVERTEVAQPLLFAIQVAMTQALARRGLRPDAVAGHSVGEVAAAWACGALSLEQAVELIHVRSTCQEVTRHLGGMAALLVSADQAREALSLPEFAGLEIAGDNSPRSVTLSGSYDQIDAFAKFARKKRWAMRKLKLDYPFHCALIEPIRNNIVDALSDLAPTDGPVQFISTVSGRSLDGRELDGEYWWQNVRRPVLFRAAVEELAALDMRVFVEIGPKPVLQNYVADSLAAIGKPGVALASFDESDRVGEDVIGGIATRAFANGASIDMEKLFGPALPLGIDLPVYAWQNQTYRPVASDETFDVFGHDDDHPLLGSRSRFNTGPYFSFIDTYLVPWLADHKVEDATVYPAAGFAEMALAAARQEFGPDSMVEVLDFDILRPMLIEDGSTRETRVDIDMAHQVIEIGSRRRLSGDDWALHVRGRVAKAPVQTAPRDERTVPTGTPSLSSEDLYLQTQRFGLNYGPAFRRAKGVYEIGERSIYVALSDAAAGDVGDSQFSLHPTLLDASFHGLFQLITRLVAPVAGTSFLPVRIGSLRLFAAGATPVGAFIDIEKASSHSVVAKFTLIAADGSVVAVADGCRFKSVHLTRPDHPDEFAFRVAALRHIEPGEVVDAGEAWEAATLGRAQALGLVASDYGEPDDADLLIDAASRSLAFSTLERFASDDRRLDPVALAGDGRLHETALPLLGRILDAVLEDGAAECSQDGIWTLAAESPYPALSTVIQALLGDHPKRIAEVAVLSRLSTSLEQILTDGLEDGNDPRLSAGLTDYFATGSQTGEALIQAASTVAEDLLGTWPDCRPLRALVLGRGASHVARLLAQGGDKVTRVVVSDADPHKVERLKLRLEGEPQIEVLTIDELNEASAFDVVLSIGALATPSRDDIASKSPELLAGGGLFISAEPEPAFFADLVGGTATDWWRDTLVGAHPIGPVAGAEALTARLIEAGFETADWGPIALAGSQTSLLVAKMPTKSAATQEELVDPVLIVAVGNDALSKALADALSSDLSRRDRKVLLAVGDMDETGAGRLDAVGSDSDGGLKDLLAAGSAKDLVLLPAMRPISGWPTKVVLRATMVIHAILNGAMKPPARLWLVAPGGAGVASHDPVSAALWGLGRVLINEYPDIETRLVDFSPTMAPAEAATRLGRLLANPGDEREFVLDLQGSSVLRVVPAKGFASRAERNRLTGECGMVLDLEHQGSPDGLAWKAVERHAPADDEIEIEVAATGLNFRDVMWALGLLPDEALEDGFAGATLGMECSGVVTRVGPTVTRFVPGDRVITFAPACFASHVKVAEKAVAPVPAQLDLEAAATIPVTFLTAYYALVDLARLEEGETILIHGGAGGVGLAALQIAHWRGAKVIATAGSPEKRALLDMLGAHHVLDSRSLAFHDEVMQLTGGDGVDVVLNSLFGEAMERSIAVLRPFGRFVELGKRDYYANSRIGLRPFRQNLSYFGVDADQLLTRRPKLATRLFDDLVKRFEEGVFSPLPYRVFDADRITDAFRLMQQSGHIGKILVRPPEMMPAPGQRPTPIHADATYLIVGGLGGFGVETARSLVERGARHLALVSRSGTVSETAGAVIADMESAGAEVRVYACDAAERPQVDKLFETIAKEMPPLKGIMHTAMVIDDALFQNLDATRIESVLAPKIAGASNLDAASRGLPIDLFVLYSSATTLIGNPGQAAYVAANAYLEGLARQRHAAGLPALTVAWGAIADVGYLARNAEVNAMLSMRMGAQALTARQALKGLHLALDAGLDDPVIAYARMNWASAKRELAIMATPLAEVVMRNVDDSVAASTGDGELGRQIAELPQREAIKLVCDILADEISHILRLPLEDIDPVRPLTEIGMDSLMALELRMAAEQKLGFDIPLLSLANGATLSAIATRVVERVQGSEGALSGDAEIVAARHVAEDEGIDVSAAMSAIEERSAETKRLI